MTSIGRIVENIQVKFADANVNRGGVYLVNEAVVPTCHAVVQSLQDLGINALVGWEGGLSRMGGYMSDVTPKMMREGIERDIRLSHGGVALVELKNGDFGKSNFATLRGLARVETNREPKRILAFITESTWVVAALGNIVEDVREGKI